MSELHTTSRHRLGTLTIWHSGLFVVATAWLFGGNIFWARIPLSIWGSLAIGLTLAGFRDRARTGASLWRPLIWLTPALALMGFIVISAINPSFDVTSFYDTKIYRPIDHVTWLPSSAIPAKSLSELWLYSGLYLSGFNLALNVNRLYQLRIFIVALAANTTVIAVLGTVQKLSGGDQMFGLITSPNSTFFGSFIYHNHWGAFAVLSVALWLGASVWLARHDDGRGIAHSPAMVAFLAIAGIVVSVPLSTSRSSTAMVIVLILGAALATGWKIYRRSVTQKHKGHGGLVAIVVGVTLTLTATYLLAAPIISQRLATTRSQLADMQARGSIGERATLYEETWQMFRTKPWTGWGFETWEMVFRRTTKLTHRGDRLPILYDQAHSDWLQSLAEVGIIGTGLLITMALLPLCQSIRQLKSDRTALYLLFGNGLIAAYAWVEFPMANPAVALLFWVTLFTAVRSARIGQS